jgi:hypothetical protein
MSGAQWKGFGRNGLWASRNTFPVFDWWAEINHGGPRSEYVSRPRIDHFPAAALEPGLWMSRAQNLSPTSICTDVDL